jgi:predicted  nucleic acid-binding Zn-ribbon protein
MSSTSTSEITQGDIDNLLAQMQKLRQGITTARESIAPLEANLAETYNEFQAVVGVLRRQSMRLQAEITSLRIQIKRFIQDEDDAPQEDIEDNDFIYDKEEAVKETSFQDPEAVDKDMLLEHIFRILDPDIDDADAELVANIQGICTDPNASLADVLEKLPWGVVWTTCSLQETLKDQYYRLDIWQQALKRQLENLNRATELLQKDQRYALWQQRQKGADEWQNFLDGCLEQQQDQNYELQGELDRLREEWRQVTNSSNL